MGLLKGPTGWRFLTSEVHLKGLAFDFWGAQGSGFKV